MHELGLGLPAPLAGLMRKPIRREAKERGRKEGRKKGAAAVKAQLFSY